MSDKILLVCDGCDAVFLRDLSSEGSRHRLGFDMDSDTDSICGTLQQIPADVQLKLFGQSRIVETRSAPHKGDTP